VWHGLLVSSGAGFQPASVGRGTSGRLETCPTLKLFVSRDGNNSNGAIDVERRVGLERLGHVSPAREQGHARRCDVAVVDDNGVR